MSERPWIGLDLGTRRIGIAVSDALGITAQPHSVLERTSFNNDVAHLTELAAELDAKGFVVGLPLRTGGQEGPEALAAREFVGALRQSSGLEVEWVDERFTTVIADRVLREQGIAASRRRKHVDKIAAAVILQGYLDRRSLS